jgi:hypothetical protein
MMLPPPPGTLSAYCSAHSTSVFPWLRFTLPSTNWSMNATPGCVARTPYRAVISRYCPLPMTACAFSSACAGWLSARYISAR